MPLPIENYAFLSDLESSCLVGSDGSIDWLTFPRFDSSACFAALLGGPEHGRWLLAPYGDGAVKQVRRRYQDNSMVLETVFTTDDGEVAVIDCMPPRDRHLEVVRLVEGRRGRVEMSTELTIRFDYGSIIPWVRTVDGRLVAVGGPDSLTLTSPVRLEGHDHTSTARFTVGEGDVVPFSLVWQPAHEDRVELRGDPVQRVDEARRWWQEWSARTTYDGDWADEVNASLRVLKGLVYEPTGGLVAAATTSLPESLGGPRNWDYRFCWLRDATYALLALLSAGYQEEAKAWRDWLLRAAAGDPSQLQIMYGVAGERRLPELELGWLPGYQGSPPVRIGNGASTQFQLDVYGEVVDALHQAAVAAGRVDAPAWDLQQVLLEFLEGAWQQPDEGIWEVRGPRRHFTHSKLMAWVAADRAVRTVEQLGARGDAQRWRRLRAEIKAWILEHGVDDRGVFVQYEGSKALDASLLMVPLVGFLPGTDERVVRTLEAIEANLVHDGFVARYRTDPTVDGLPAGEGTFLLCSFMLAQVQHLAGRHQDGCDTFERLLAVRNDVGLLAEQYDPHSGRLLGNMPQAFSHTALVNTAALLSGADGRRSGAVGSDTGAPSRGPGA